MLILLSCLGIKAQTTDVQIKVVSENEAVIGANIYLESDKKSAVTDAEGKAQFSNVSNGKQTIIISYLGFETLKKTIQIPGQSVFIFHLEATENELEEVVLQTSRTRRTFRKIPTLIEFINS